MYQNRQLSTLVARLIRRQLLKYPHLLIVQKCTNILNSERSLDKQPAHGFSGIRRPFCTYPLGCCFLGVVTFT
jgi:hypothetical protein